MRKETSGCEKRDVTSVAFSIGWGNGQLGRKYELGLGVYILGECYRVSAQQRCMDCEWELS